jgi:hypothetical protein
MSHVSTHARAYAMEYEMCTTLSVGETFDYFELEGELGEVMKMKPRETAKCKEAFMSVLSQGEKFTFGGVRFETFHY